MRKGFGIFWNSLKNALQELRVNKTRTFFSLFGVTIGIFCIITVLTTVQSLKNNVKESLASLGGTTIYIEKWPWAGGPDIPWWKYMRRPEPKMEEMGAIAEMSSYTENTAFVSFNQSNVEYKEDALQNVSWYAPTENFNHIQEVNIGFGRYLNMSEFRSGSPAVVMGFNNAEKLFGNPESAVGKQVQLKGRTVTIVGVTRKEGQSMMGGWDFDNIVILPYNFARQFSNTRYESRMLMVKAKEGVPLDAIKDELRGILRGIRKLKPTEEDNFALNDVTAGAKPMEAFFGSVNLGGFIIGGFSLIVGLFGIANIMFVTVKERTPQIGLKKAMGARKSYILTEFLIESSLLCLLGGIIGLLLVFIVTLIMSKFMPFAVSLTVSTISLGLGISIIVGLLSGIIPAWNAAKLDPVVAIRS